MNYTSPSLENLIYLPPFARFILDKKLLEYVEMQVKLSEELDVPLMKHLKHLTEVEVFKT